MTPLNPPLVRGEIGEIYFPPLSIRQSLLAEWRGLGWGERGCAHVFATMGGQEV
jgi:hypothetical protein